ncbi:hypothetical protein LJR164_001326 [Phenylobacterium sp. LjRoot164]|uniref:DUF1579 domain-containing protein n=1 Tax=unclassified Phenylobacterium TaxID=2640670 RepID=UPI003ECDBE5C
MGSAHDFDFNHGDWDVTNRRLKVRGVGSDDWEVFPSYEKAELWMGGAVSIDESDFPTKGFKGMTLRLYEPGEDRWAIYWINSKDGQLQPPVYGRFKDGKGVFAGDDVDDGRPVKVLFDWSGTDTETPRWSQAFSYDDGATWETNWIMEFRRPAR